MMLDWLILYLADPEIEANDLYNSMFEHFSNEIPFHYLIEQPEPTYTSSNYQRFHLKKPLPEYS